MDDTSGELRDCRSKITAEADQMLEAVSRATGRDKSEIVREVMQGWFLEEFRKHRMISRFFREPKGADGASDGDRSPDA